MALLLSFISIAGYYSDYDNWVRVWIHRSAKTIFEIVTPVFWVLRSDDISEYALRIITRWKIFST